MLKQTNLITLCLCFFSFFGNAQIETVQHTHNQRNLTEYTNFVASQSNTDYFSDHDHDLWHYYMNRPHPNVTVLNNWFNEAAAEFGVPAKLLKVIGQVENNWTQIGPSIDRGWGIMHLVNNPHTNTLKEAALLLGLDQQTLKDDPQQNIRGAAALLAKFAGPEVVGQSNVELWFHACKEFSGLGKDEFKTMQAETYFKTLKNGIVSQTVWDETIQIQAIPELNIPERIVTPEEAEQRVSADYGPAISYITPCNYGSGRNFSIDTWVNHWIGVGSYAGAISWFHTCRPSAPSSAHFVIRSSDGEITQVVGVGNTAYHCGASGYPYNNSRSIGIEHEATTSNPGLWNSTAMLNASTTMACYFTGIYNIPPTRSLPGIREHNEMPGTNTSCAGNIPWTTWMNGYTTCVNGGSPIVLDCSNAVTLTCGVTYSGPSSTAISAVTSYACNTWTETGPERVHKITATGTGTLTAQLSNYTGDLDVYILGSCDPNDCLGTVGPDNANFSNAIAGQVYYIVVDADDGSGSAYDLVVTCPTGGPVNGLDCSNSVALSCGVPYNGPSSSATSNVETYGCNTWTEAGPERVHTITPSSNGTLTAQLSGYTGDLDVYILGSCDPSDCIGTVGSDNATLTNAIAGQTYYIVVDADDGSGSAYTLMVDCPQSGFNCASAIPLTCGQVYTGGSSTAASQVDTYGCNNWTETGPERVHSITVPASGTITASLSNYTGDLDVYILASCDPLDCVGTVTTDQATYTNAVAGQTYYIVVDADDGSGSGYDLVVDCPITGLDCQNAIALNCGVTYTGPSSSATSLVDTYGCNIWTETGPERIHSIVAPANGTITASLSNYTGDLDVYILASCDPLDCVGTVTSDQATYTNAIAGQTYYIVVDADDGSGSGYDLIVDCPLTGLDCGNAIALSCGVNYSGPSSSAASLVSAYACNTWTETGPERLHLITVSASGTLTASLSNYTGDLDVYILGSCDPNDCIGTVSSDSATFPNAVAGQTYYIVVDADDGSGSAYNLMVDCPPTSGCIDNLLVNGIQSGTQVFKANLTVTSDATITSGANVDMHANDCILLEAGFGSDANADLHIYIDPCQ